MSRFQPVKFANVPYANMTVGPDDLLAYDKIGPKYEAANPYDFSGAVTSPYGDVIPRVQETFRDPEVSGKIARTDRFDLASAQPVANWSIDPSGEITDMPYQPMGSYFDPTRYPAGQPTMEGKVLGELLLQKIGNPDVFKDLGEHQNPAQFYGQSGPTQSMTPEEELKYIGPYR